MGTARPPRPPPPPLTPLAENHFSKKTLAEMGGTPSSPLTESPLSFSGIFSLTGLKMMYLYQIRLKMNPKGHITDQKGLKMYVKGKKLSFRI